MSQDAELIRILETARSERNRQAYYRALARFGDPYGKLALGVVDQSLISGRTARFFAEFIAKQWGRPLSPALWLQISYKLMEEDYARRKISQGNDQTNNLSWITIRNYHVATFEKFGIPGRAWTAFIPLELAGTTGAAGMWSDMLRRDIIIVGLETVLTVLGPIADQAGLFPNVFTTLTTPPSIQAAMLFATLARDMSDRTSLQRCKNDLEALRCVARSTEQQDAVLWLDGLCQTSAPMVWETIKATTMTNIIGTEHSIERLRDRTANFFSGWPSPSLLLR